MIGAMHMMVGLLGAANLKATPSSASGYAIGTGTSGVVNSGNVVITGNNGAVSWTHVSGDAMTISNAAGTTVYWSATVFNTTNKNSVWRCTNGTRTIDVPVTLDRDSSA